MEKNVDYMLVFSFAFLPLVISSLFLFSLVQLFSFLLQYNDNYDYNLFCFNIQNKHSL